jgi:uncharacterized repeat protein (TIGR03837 family)
MRWDLFCHVVDNFGDIGVCWRLAADLASRGEQVRLWVDDTAALQWMAPGGAPGVSVLPWSEEMAANEAGDVVVEAFGCDLPAAFVQGMSARTTPPLWINFEYLSAEAYVQRSHGLPSPQLAGTGRGMTKWFFYPGFVSGTGGLIRELDLQLRMRTFVPQDWLAARGLQRRENERLVSLFCYNNAALPELLRVLAERPTLLLATAGDNSRQVLQCLGTGLQQGNLRASLLPWLSQRDFDHLLWASDVNFVRGEDSFVRAQWAGVPFVWQAYAQSDGAQTRKLDAFLDLFLDGADAPLNGDIRRLWAVWNGLMQAPLHLPSLKPWRDVSRSWREGLLTQRDLTAQLLDFVEEKR